MNKLRSLFFLFFLSFTFTLMGIELSTSFDICPIKLDAQTLILLNKLNEETVSLNESSLKAMQENPPAVAKRILPQVKKIENIEIPSLQGPIKSRLYFPHNDGPLPVFVFFHGGGWVLGTLDDYDDLCQEICYRTPCIVISVDYRLAPRFPFPIPLLDCYAATQWISQNVPSMGGDPQRLAIGGDSAGGNLAAAVTLMAREKRSPFIQQQILIYPALNAQLDTLSQYLFANGYYLTRNLMQLFWKMYLPKSSDRQNPYACPLLASTLSKLPPALVIIADADPLRDEGLAYAWRLREEKVPVVLKRYASIHGFISYDELDIARQAIKELTQYLRQGFYSNQP